MSKLKFEDVDRVVYDWFKQLCAVSAPVLRVNIQDAAVCSAAKLGINFVASSSLLLMFHL